MCKHILSYFSINEYIFNYNKDDIYYKENTGKKIAKILATINPAIQKKFHE